MKKIISLVLVICMIFTMSSIALAEEATLTLNVTTQAPYYEGDEISVEVDNTTLPENAYWVEFLLGEDVVSTAKVGRDELVCTFSGLDSGNYTVSAKALTVSREGLGSGSVPVEVILNPSATTITVNGFSATDDEGVFSLENDDEIKVLLSNSDYSTAKFLLNHEEVTPTTEADVDGIDITDMLKKYSALGDNVLTVKAYDANDKEYEQENLFLFYGNQKGKQEMIRLNNNIDNDAAFKEEKTDYPQPTGTTNAFEKLGGEFSVIETEDTSRGKSLVMGIKELDSTGEQPASFYLEDKQEKGTYIIEASYFFPNTNVTAHIHLQENGGGAQELVEFRNGGGIISLRKNDKGNTDRVSIGTYKANQWYELKFIIYSDATYDFYLDDVPLVEKKSIIRSSGSFNRIRFGVCNKNVASHDAHTPTPVGGKVYIDDIKITAILDIPEIEEVSLSGDNAVVFKPSIPISGDDLVGDTPEENMIKLTNDAGEDIAVKAVSYDEASGEYTLTTETRFNAGVEYALLLKKGLDVRDSLETSKNIRKTFTVNTVGDNEITVGEESFSVVGGKLEFTANLANVTEPVSALMYIFKDNKLTDVKAAHVSAGATEISVAGKPLLKGETAKVYIFKSSLAEAVTVKSFSYSK